MKRVALCLAVLFVASAVLASDNLRAQEPIHAPAPLAEPQPQPQGPRHQRRFKVAPFGVWVRTNAPGYPAYRYTYRGEIYGAQRPAIFQYGYEHEMQENGPFSLNGQWH